MGENVFNFGFGPFLYFLLIKVLIYTVGVKSMSPVKYWTNIYNYTLYFHSGKQQNSILLFLDYIRIMT